MRLTISHGDLIEARHLVLLGHCTGEPPAPLMQRLDIPLKGAIAAARALPDALGAHMRIDAPHAHPPGVLLVGLGERGTLTRSRLQGAVRDAIGDQRRVSALLMGTSGVRALPIYASVQAILAGAQQAGVEELELIELYADRVAAMIRTARRLGHTHSLCALPSRQAAAPRRYLPAPPLHRLRISRAGGRLQFERLSAHAQAGTTSGASLEGDGEALVAPLTAPEGIDPAQRTALSEELLPRSIRTLLSQGADVSLIVDAETAWIPWEALAVDAAPIPLSVRAAMTRRIHVPTDTVKAVAPPAARVLVIADPLSPADPNPLLRSEARALVGRLQAHGLDVRAEIPSAGELGASGETLRELLCSEPWRILHFYGHGGRVRARTGMIAGTDLGEGVIDIDIIFPETLREMPCVPELVFVNGCWAGRVAEGERSAAVASLAQTLAQMGVRMLVAAAWKIGDAEADAFADGFYEALLSGATFGESVRQGRQQCFALCQQSGANSWAAYQCYGDPGYAFTRRHVSLTGDVLAIEAPVLLARAQPALLQEALVHGIAPVQAKLQRLAKSSASSTELPEVLGETWRKLACWDAAQAQLARVAAAGQLQVIKSLIDAELLGACERWRAGEDVSQRMEAVGRRIDALLALQPAPAWHNLRAAWRKRQVWMTGQLDLLASVHAGYGEAAGLSPSTYSLINVAHLALLRGRRDEALAACDTAARALLQEARTSPHFWVRLASARVALFRCLLGEGSEAEVLTRYRSHLDSIYNPQQLSLVRDYFDIAADILAQQERGEQAARLRRIRSALQAHVRTRYPGDAERVFGDWEGR